MGDALSASRSRPLTGSWNEPQCLLDTAAQKHSTSEGKSSKGQEEIEELAVAAEAGDRNQ